MAKQHGKTGALFFTPTITAITIAFTDDDPDTITDSGSGFVDAGFKPGDLITVSGSTSNDGNYTIDTGGVAAGVLTLVIGDSLTGEIAGDNVTVFAALPGQQIAAFFGISIDDGVELVDVTDFEAGALGFRKYQAGLRDWTGAAEGFWLTDDFRNFMIGQELTIQFFILYDDDPNIDTVHLWQGKAIVSGIPVDADVSDVVHENLTFEGTGTASIQGTGIAFVDGGGGADTITDTGNGFIRAGFQAGHKITVRGSTTSDGAYTIVSVVAGTITLATGSLPGNEAAGDTVTIFAGVQLAPITAAWPA